MESLEKNSAKRGIDAVGITLLFALVAVAIAAASAALAFGWFRSPWEMAGWLVAGLAFLVVGLGLHSHRPPKNTSVYGSAQPASEDEARAAARGKIQSTPIHDQTFRD